MKNLNKRKNNTCVFKKELFLLLTLYIRIYAADVIILFIGANHLHNLKLTNHNSEVITDTLKLTSCNKKLTNKNFQLTTFY